MNTVTARGYVLSGIDDLEIIHNEENRLKRLLTPNEIHTKFDTPITGEIPLRVYEKAERACWAITKRIENKVHFWIKSMENAGNLQEINKFSDLKMRHRIDKEIREQGIEFPLAQTTSLRDRIRSRKTEDDEF